MDWRDRVPACFGDQDLIFASHPTDEERAKKAIREAKAAGASRDDFEKEMVWHIYKNVTADGFLQEHTKEQVRRLEAGLPPIRATDHGGWPPRWRAERPLSLLKQSADAVATRRES